MLVVLVATQVVGFVVLYLLLRRYLGRRTTATVDPVELRCEVNELLAELNGTTERNVALLEDGIRRLDALLRRVDRHGAQPPPSDGIDAPGALRTQVLRMRRLGFSKAAITERLSAGMRGPSVAPKTTTTGARGSSAELARPASREEVELLVDLASGRSTRRG